jgi:Rho family protein
MYTVIPEPPKSYERSTHATSDIFIDNTHVELSLWDTAGQEEFDRLRSLSYDNTHAIMLCFSVNLRRDLIRWEIRLTLDRSTRLTR